MIQVSETLFRGPRPKSFADLKEKGITKVINLQSGFHEELHDDEYEKENAADFGIVEYNISCSDLLPPKEWQVDKVLKIIQQPGVTYIHCLHGKDRTGYMCAAYRMAVEGWDFRESLVEMFNHGFHKVPYLIWVPTLKKYEGEICHHKLGESEGGYAICDSCGTEVYTGEADE